MKPQHVIVDGYSLLYHEPRLKHPAAGQLQSAREQLIARLNAVAGLLADRITVVFDGRDLPGDQPEREPSVVEVIFSPAHQTADTMIERLAHHSVNPAGLLVITSDRAERDTVGAAGAHTMGCTEFLELLVQTEAELRRRAAAMHQRVPAPTLGDFFPKKN